jgi:hypothetical protein
MLNAERMLRERPSDTGLRRLMPRLAARVAQRPGTLGHLDVLAFIDPMDPVTADRPEKERPTRLVANALSVMGPALPPGVRVPLRTALERLSDLLCGFDRPPRQIDPSERELASRVSPLLAAKLTSLTRQMRVRAVELKVVDSDKADVEVVDAKPPVLLISVPLLDRPEKELLFLLARGLEWVRSGGLFIQDREPSGSTAQAEQWVVALASALSAPLPSDLKIDDEKVEQLRHWGVIPDVLDRQDRESVLKALYAYHQSPSELGLYLRAQEQMAQRIGLLASGDLLTALRATARSLAGPAVLEPDAVNERIRLMDDNESLAELARFGVSELCKKLRRSTTVPRY